MAAVVNGSGTAVASKLPLDGIQMAGKTGTAQVFRLGERGHQANWALRDHALFIAFAPADKPRYAIGCIIEHGGFGASAAAPIVRDSMTYLFDKQKALAALAPLEEQWGGTLAERNARQLGGLQDASARPRHDHVGDHPAAARAAAVAADLPGRRDRRVRLSSLYSAAGGSVQPWAMKQGVMVLFFLSASRSACRGIRAKRRSRRSPFPPTASSCSC